VTYLLLIESNENATRKRLHWVRLMRAIKARDRNRQEGSRLIGAVVEKAELLAAFTIVEC
jgi:chlorite dismutase